MPSAYEWVGAVGGVLGTVGGIAGTWMGWVSIKRSRQDKNLDLRLQIKREEQGTLADLEAVPGVMAAARRSRMALLSFRGALNSSVRREYEAAHATDVQALEVLREACAHLGSDVSKLDTSALEKRIAENHALKRRVDDLTSKYRGHLEDDERMRDRLANTKHPGA